VGVFAARAVLSRYGTEVVPQLLLALGHPARAEAASASLVTLGEAVVLPVRDVLVRRDSPELARVWAARTIGALGTRAVGIRRDLEDMAGASGGALLLAVLEAHWRVVAESDFIRTRYAPLLAGPDPRVRERTARLLECMGRFASFALDDLAKRSGDADPRVRRAAEWALAAIHDDAARLPD